MRLDIVKDVSPFIKKWSLYLINYASRPKDLRASGGLAPPFLTSTLDNGVQFHAPADTSGERGPSSQRIGGWMGPSDGPNTVE
jgi:hypothetical protein